MKIAVFIRQMNYLVFLLIIDGVMGKENIDFAFAKSRSNGGGLPILNSVEVSTIQCYLRPLDVNIFGKLFHYSFT